MSRGGVWIDHRKAVVVSLDIPEPRTTHLESHVEKHPERAGDSPLKGRFEPRQVPPDDRRQMALTRELNEYYDQVIGAVRNLDALLILGPGEAKGELRHRLDKHKLGKRVAAMEAADKMTDREIAARIREFFDATG